MAIPWPRRLTEMPEASKAKEPNGCETKSNRVWGALAGICLCLAFEVLKLTYDLSAIQPSLRDLGLSKLAPALKRRAIFTMSLRDKALAEFPIDIWPPDWLLMCLTS